MLQSNEKCKAYVTRDEKVIAKASHLSYFPLVIQKAYGSTLEDVDGNTFIDFIAGASSMNLGYRHPAVTAAIREQLDNFPQFTAAYSYNVQMIELAEKLTSILPGDFPKKVSMGHCGSDANDAAIKFCRAFTGRSKIITFTGAYHGSTYGAISLSAVTTRMRGKMGPFLPDVYSVPYCNCYRCPYGKHQGTCGLECMGVLETVFQTTLPVDETAAMIVEPILGDGGMIVPSHRFMRCLYEICKENGILFISEEVQQGFGRTGKWFAMEHFGIAPDGIIMGKALGGGLPMGAFAARADIMDSLDAPAHLFTLAGNAIGSAAAKALLEEIAQPGFMDKINEKGARIMAAFRELAKTHSIIGDVRGLGMSIGVDLVKDRTTKEPANEATKKIIYRCYEQGLMLISLAGNVLRIQPPLVITDQEIDRAMDILARSFADYEMGKIPDSVFQIVKGW